MSPPSNNADPAASKASKQEFKQPSRTGSLKLEVPMPKHELNDAPKKSETIAEGRSESSGLGVPEEDDDPIEFGLKMRVTLINPS